MLNLFNRWAKKASTAVGSPWAFTIAFAAVLLWGISGPLFKFSDTWQLVINTSTTIITFLMVFLIQSTQNRDSRAIHLKLDEIIRSIDGARNEIIDLEDAKDDQLDKLEQEFRRMKSEGTAGADAVLSAIHSVRTSR